MDCDAIYVLLDAYVDRELDVAHDLAIAAHLQTCPRCAQQYEALLALQGAVRTRGTYFASPPSLRQRLRTTLRRAAPAPFLRSPDSVLTAVGLLVLVLGGVYMWRSWSPLTLTDGLVREVVAAHVRSLQVDHLTDLASADTHTLKPWLSDKLAFAPPVIDLAPHGFQLLGARLDYLNDRAVAALVYRRRQHRINLWVAPAGPTAATAAALATHHGYHVLHWVHAGMAYWAVSDLNREELSLFKQLL
ncbi:MAG TPA: zf-HC2 domain-containing protein [Candidatus Tectomicrobia bacterium]